MKFGILISTRELLSRVILMTVLIGLASMVAGCDDVEDTEEYEQGYWDGVDDVCRRFYRDLPEGIYSSYRPRDCRRSY